MLPHQDGPQSNLRDNPRHWGSLESEINRRRPGCIQASCTLSFLREKSHLDCHSSCWCDRRTSDPTKTRGPNFQQVELQGIAARRDCVSQHPQTSTQPWGWAAEMRSGVLASRPGALSRFHHDFPALQHLETEETQALGMVEPHGEEHGPRSHPMEKQRPPQDQPTTALDVSEKGTSTPLLSPSKCGAGDSSCSNPYWYHVEPSGGLHSVTVRNCGVAASNMLKPTAASAVGGCVTGDLRSAAHLPSPSHSLL